MPLTRIPKCEKHDIGLHKMETVYFEWEFRYQITNKSFTRNVAMAALFKAY